MARLLELAATESRFTGNAFAWTTDGPAYRFWRRTGDGELPGQWTEILDSDLLRARALPNGMRVSGLRIVDEPVRGAMRLVFSPRGPALPFRIEISLGSARALVAASPVGELLVSSSAGAAGD